MCQHLNIISQLNLFRAVSLLKACACEYFPATCFVSLNVSIYLSVCSINVRTIQCFTKLPSDSEVYFLSSFCYSVSLFLLFLSLISIFLHHLSLSLRVCLSVCPQSLSLCFSYLSLRSLLSLCACLFVSKCLSVCLSASLSLSLSLSFLSYSHERRANHKIHIGITISETHTFITCAMKVPIPIF